MVALALVTAGGATPAAGQLRPFAIDRFAVSIRVHRDASLDVREAITWRFHGANRTIHRIIPARHARGLDYALRLDDIRVLDEAFRPLDTRVSISGGQVRIAAHVPGAGEGPRTVTVVYRARQGVFPVDGRDELYWNAIGDGWDVPIGSAEVAVIGPPGSPAEGVRAIAHAGHGGSASTDYAIERAGDLVTVRTTRPLRPREGLAIAVVWPAGAVGGPPLWRRAWWLAADNWPLGLPVLALALGAVAWRWYGRDPLTNLSVKPEYAPPPDLSPAEASALLRERAEPRDVVATVVDLAVRGYLHVEPVTSADGSTDFLFQRLKPVAGDPALSPFELFVLARLFHTDWSINMRLLSDVRRDYDMVFPPIRDALYRTLVRRRLFAASPEAVRRTWLGLGISIVVAGAGASAAPPPWVGYAGRVLGLGLMLSGAVIAAWSPFMPRRTRAGARAAVRIRGFQEFLERVERDRLEHMPSDALHRLLPWAIALGVTERWIWKFDGLAVDGPAWFGSDGAFNAADYERALRMFSRRTEDAIAASAQSGHGGRRSGGAGGAG